MVEELSALFGEPPDVVHRRWAVKSRIAVFRMMALASVIVLCRPSSLTFILSVARRLKMAIIFSSFFTRLERRGRIQVLMASSRPTCSAGDIFCSVDRLFASSASFAAFLRFQALIGLG